MRLIVTGANGAGKSHLAARLGALRPDIPVISFDALKLKRNWAQRPRADIETDLKQAIAGKAWILEGGPSLLPLALEHADAVIWLDPPERLRAWHLLARPWRNLGKTRPELPEGNDDWPTEQYIFAFRSLRARRKFKQGISERLGKVEVLTLWHCRTQIQIDAAVKAWFEAAAKQP